ncbi:hypothetical protein [Paenibacillus xylaniclasticus]|uniref:hypothetical protein n=1 Tax=Paenibacillus xylaniclasticus TaxID=588083 RepID=UPI00157FAB5D|nr:MULTISPECIES: hypothetical protein [Paenibacillus]GFN29811.1 hypothetical protein PCURB6_00710 [Paenibacillus curdlanolyticus]
MDEGRFTGAYYYPIEQIEPFMASHGFRMTKLIGSSSIVLEMIYREAANPYNLAVSSHLLYIREKV